VLTEGNTAMTSIASEALVFIVNPAMPRKFWKANWRELAERSQALVVNEAHEALGRKPPAPTEERAAALAEVQAIAPSTPRIVARLQEPFREWAGPYLESLVDGEPATR
jgi:hypothetical protein